MDISTCQWHVCTTWHASLPSTRKQCTVTGNTLCTAVTALQVDIYLLVLPAWPPAGNPPAHHPALALAPLQRLPGPRTASTGARCVSWLPRSPGSPAALLAAWPSDLLMYTWGPSGQGELHRLPAGWGAHATRGWHARCPTELVTP